jgi:hypothetical protein
LAAALDQLHTPQAETVFGKRWDVGANMWFVAQEELRRYNYVTPKNYLDFIGNYKRSLGASRKEVDEMAARLDGGLQKLIQAAVEVDAMQKDLTEAKVVVQRATEECNELLTVGAARHVPMWLQYTHRWEHKFPRTLIMA